VKGIEYDIKIKIFYRAASEMWSNSIKEYFCIEISEAMIELSERLAKAAKPEIKNIFYRQYFPASMNVNFYKMMPLF